MLQHAFLLAIVAVDTPENELSKVSQNTGVSSSSCGGLAEVHDWIGAATSNNMRETGPSFPGWAMIRLVRPHWHALSLALQRSENGLVSGISSRESLWHILSRPADFGMY